MAGCFGSDPEDRHFENQLLNHLDGEYCCEKCECTVEEDDIKEALYYDVLCKECYEEIMES